MKLRLPGLATLLHLLIAGSVPAQEVPGKSILVDVAHGQRFWNDPSALTDREDHEAARVRYMAGELDPSGPAGDGAELPDAQSMVDDLERFLRDQRTDDA